MLRNIKKLSIHGAGIVQTLLAIIFISLAALVMSGTLKEFTYYLSNKNRAIDTAMSFESLIIHASQDLELLRPIASTLMNGIVPTNFSIKHNVGGTIVDIAKLGVTLTFDENGRPCAANPNVCRIESKIDIRCDSTTTYADCRLAYQIKVITKNGKEIQIQSFGSKSENLQDDPRNYDLMLAYDVFSQEKISSASNPGEHIITGYNKFNGDIFVARLPNLSCANGTISNGMFFSNGSFKMDCIAAKKASCPPNYSLHKLSMINADPRIQDTTPPDCVFVSQKEVPWNRSLTPAPFISIKLCPQFYKTRATCIPQNSAVTSITGTCSENYDCSTTDINGSRIQRTCTRTFDGTRPSPPSISIVDGTQSATCTTINGSGTCGGVSYFTNPNVEMTGTCVLTEPEYIQGTWL